MKTLKSCGFLIVRGNPIESFLLMKHPKRYDLPKGHVDPGESEMECALRELEEETGISASDLELDSGFRFTTTYLVRPKRLSYSEAQKTLVVFLARLRQEVAIVPTEHESFLWVKWDPPHEIQRETIDPLLTEVAKHVAAA